MFVLLAGAPNCGRGIVYPVALGRHVGATTRNERGKWKSVGSTMYDQQQRGSRLPW